MKTPMPLDFGEVLLKTSWLTSEERGALFMLLLNLWHWNGELNYDLGQLQRMAMVDARRWPEVWAELSGFFMIEDGKVSHPWITRDLARVRRGALIQPSARSEAVRRSWNSMQPTTSPRIMERDGHQCQECGSTDRLTIDHVIPILLGGNNQDDNLRVLCRTCNSRKGSSWPASE